jgi:hypothetical protein
LRILDRPPTADSSAGVQKLPTGFVSLVANAECRGEDGRVVRSQVLSRTVMSGDKLAKLEWTRDVELMHRQTNSQECPVSWLCILGY